MTGTCEHTNYPSDAIMRIISCITELLLACQEILLSMDLAI